MEKIYNLVKKDNKFIFERIYKNEKDLVNELSIKKITSYLRPHRYILEHEKLFSFLKINRSSFEECSPKEIELIINTNLVDFVNSEYHLLFEASYIKNLEVTYVADEKDLKQISFTNVNVYKKLFSAYLDYSQYEKMFFWKINKKTINACIDMVYDDCEFIEKKESYFSAEIEYIQSNFNSTIVKG